MNIKLLNQHFTGLLKRPSDIDFEQERWLENYIEDDPLEYIDVSNAIKLLCYRVEELELLAIELAENSATLAGPLSCEAEIMIQTLAEHGITPESRNRNYEHTRHQ